MSEGGKITRRRFGKGLLAILGLVAVEGAAQQAPIINTSFSFIRGAYSVLSDLFPSPMPEPDPNLVRHWESQLKDFQAYDESHVPPTVEDEIIGSSTVNRFAIYAARHSNQTGFQNPTIIRGFEGAYTIRDIYPRLEAIFGNHYPNRIVVYLGNSLEHTTLRQAMFDFLSFDNRVKALRPHSQRLYIEMIPSPRRWAEHEDQKSLNKFMADNSGRGYRVIPMYNSFVSVDSGQESPKSSLFEDGLHPSEEAYKTIFTPTVVKYLPPVTS